MLLTVTINCQLIVAALQSVFYFYIALKHVSFLIKAHYTVPGLYSAWF